MNSGHVACAYTTKFSQCTAKPSILACTELQREHAWPLKKRIPSMDMSVKQRIESCQIHALLQHVTDHGNNANNFKEVGALRRQPKTASCTRSRPRCHGKHETGAAPQEHKEHRRRRPGHHTRTTHGGTHRTGGGRETRRPRTHAFVHMPPPREPVVHGRAYTAVACVRESEVRAQSGAWSALSVCACCGACGRSPSFHGVAELHVAVLWARRNRAACMSKEFGGGPSSKQEFLEMGPFLSLGLLIWVNKT